MYHIRIGQSGKKRASTAREVFHEEGPTGRHGRGCISGCGKMTEAMRQRGEAETDENIDGLVDKILKEQDENADEDA